MLLSATNDDATLYRALDEGLSAFVPKDGPPGGVLAAIRHAAAGAAVVQRGRARGRAGPAAAPATGCSASARSQVLGLMRDGISLPGIAERLAVSEATVKTYVARLYTKLRVNNRSQALMAAVNQGLLDSAEPPEPLRARVDRERRGAHEKWRNRDSTGRRPHNERS